MKKLFAISLLTLLAPPAFGASYSFVGGRANNSWQEPANWSPAGVPGMGDMATIAIVNGGPRVTEDVTIASVVVRNSAGIAIEGGITLAVAAMTLNHAHGDTISGNGKLVVAQGGTLVSDNAPGVAHTVNAELDNRGTVRVAAGVLNLKLGRSSGTLDATAPDTKIVTPLPGGNTMISSGALLGTIQVGGFGNSALQLNAPTQIAGRLILFDFLTGEGPLTVASGGRIEVENPGFARTPGLVVPVTVARGGLLDISKSSLAVSRDLTLEGDVVTGPSAVQLIVADGTTRLAGGAIAATDVRLTGGTLSGAGMVRANVSNEGGTVAPSGALTVSGTYAQNGAASFAVMVGSSAPVLAVGGDAALDGKIVISAGAGFTCGAAMKVMTFAGRRGEFRTPSAGMTGLMPAYSTGDVSLMPAAGSSCAPAQNGGGGNMNGGGGGNMNGGGGGNMNGGGVRQPSEISEEDDSVQGGCTCVVADRPSAGFMAFALALLLVRRRRR